VLFDLPVRNTQVGLKLYKREVLNKILPKTKINGFAFDIEMLSLAYQSGYKNIGEIPVKVNLILGNDSKSLDLNLIKSSINMFFDTLKVCLKI
jgi:hypothetical protein